jgi:transcription elongation factor GreB
VLFGATVEVEDEAGNCLHFTIVGEDEADIAHNKVSYVSPIAKALIGRKVGDSVMWKRPAGNLSLDIIEINY